MKKEIKKQAWRYYHLVRNPYSTKGKAASAQHGVVAAMDIYESFHLVQRNSTWAGRDDLLHFSKFAADQVPEDKEHPAQIPAMCT